MSALTCLAGNIALFIIFLLRKLIRREMIIVLPQLFIVSLMGTSLPLAWYMVQSNHSYMHFWFTYRTLSGSFVYAVASIMLIVNSQENRNQRPKIPAL